MGTQIMSEQAVDRAFPGIGRLYYFLAQAALAAVMIAIVIRFGPESTVVQAAGLVAMMAGFVLDVLRLRNIGVSQWFAMLRLVPYVSSIMEIWMLSAQTGWIEGRRFDRAGRIVLAMNAVLIAFLIFIILRAQVPVLDII
jgi:uncharacterized membrane protein YhaH (DUF805 family)